MNKVHVHVIILLCFQSNNKTAAGPKSDWRKKREEFIATLRAAKLAQQHIKNGGDPRDLPPPPPSDTSHYIPCPYCNRRFVFYMFLVARLLYNLLWMFVCRSVRQALGGICDFSWLPFKIDGCNNFRILPIYMSVSLTVFWFILKDIIYLAAFIDRYFKWRFIWPMKIYSIARLDRKFI